MTRAPAGVTLCAVGGRCAEPAGEAWRARVCYVATMAEGEGSGWVTQGQFADMAGVSERTVRRWVKSGRVPTVDRAGTRRIHLSQVREKLPATYEALRDEQHNHQGGAGRDG